MKKYYFMCGDGTKSVTCAVSPDGVPVGYKMIEALRNVNSLSFDYTLKSIRFGKRIIYSDDLSKVKNIWLDCQPNKEGWALYSERLQMLINNHLTGKEGLKWISCSVVCKEEQRRYFIPYFSEPLDVLDFDNSYYGHREPRIENLIKPVFSYVKIQSYTLFPKPTTYDFWKMPSGVYVSEDLKKAIKKEKMQGICFEEVAVS